MKIYTKTGDTGTTALFGGKRVSKSDSQVDAYGNVDELTSFIGLMLTKIDEVDKEAFITVQKELYEIMGVLAGAKFDLSSLDYAISLFEKRIDETETKLPPLHRFILPGGNEVSAIIHIVRAICRRSERSIVHLLNCPESETHVDRQSISITIKYLNRLSDFLFVMARYYGKDNEIMT